MLAASLKSTTTGNAEIRSYDRGMRDVESSWGWSSLPGNVKVSREETSGLTVLSSTIPRDFVMKFMLLCYDDEQAWGRAGQAALRAAMGEAAQLTHELHARGQYILASPLEPSNTARSVRVRNGKVTVTDGPFAETNEVLDGFYLIDVPDVEAAIRVAERHPGAQLGTVEIRPLLELPGLPD